MSPPQAICLVIGYASLLIESTQVTFRQVTLLLLNPAEDNVAVGTQWQLLVYTVQTCWLASDAQTACQQCDGCFMETMQKLDVAMVIQ